VVSDHPFSDIPRHLLAAVEANSELEIVTACQVARVKTLASLSIDYLLLYLNACCLLSKDIAREHNCVNEN
jgi:hypothetical protein